MKKTLLYLFMFLSITFPVFAQTDSCNYSVTDDQIDNGLLLLGGQRVAIDFKVNPEIQMQIHYFSPNLCFFDTTGVPPTGVTYTLNILNNGTDSLPGTQIFTTSATMSAINSVGTFSGMGTPVYVYKVKLIPANPIILPVSNTSQKYWIEVAMSVPGMIQSSTCPVTDETDAAWVPSSSSWVPTTDGASVDKLVCTFKATCAISNKIDESDADAIEVFPNPIENTLNIRVNNGEIIKEISIIDALGRIVLITQTESGLVNTESFPRGIYSLLLRTNRSEYQIKMIKL